MFIVAADASVVGVVELVIDILAGQCEISVIYMIYRTLATIACSRLITAPICFQINTHFLCDFYEVV